MQHWEQNYSFEFRRIQKKNHKLGQRCKKRVHIWKSFKTKPLVAQKTPKSIGFFVSSGVNILIEIFLYFYSYQTKTILHLHVVDYLWLLFSQTRRYPGTFREPTSYCLRWEWANVLKGSGGPCVRPQVESHWVWPEIKMWRTQCRSNVILSSLTL